MSTQPITLEPMTSEAAAAIRQWPSYPPSVAALDFALRKDGWLDQFPESPHSHRYAAWLGDNLVGFSLLVDIAAAGAEFFIALHPAHFGHGVGERITRQTLLLGFKDLGLSRIHLKVRDWHKQAIALYERVGFMKYGTCVAPIQGQSVHFITMEIFPHTMRG